jgi:glycosyltransferase involved in cell wall biosynthesis
LKVTIITVCFNSVKTVEETIISVISQNYPNLEYIVIDGGSTDGTLDLINKYSDKISLIISEPDNGVYDAMNKGIRLASGDVIAMLNSDDIYRSDDVVSRLISLMCRKQVDIVYADLVVVDRLRCSRVLRYYDSGGFSPAKMKFGLMPAHPTFFAKKIVYNKVGEYRTDYKIAADFEIMVRIFCCNKFTYAHLPEALIEMKNGGISSSGFSSILRLNLEIIEACKINGIYTNFLFLLVKIPKKIIEILVLRNRS